MQRVKVNVLMADRKFRKLIVSLRPKAKEELVEKKRNVMVSCYIVFQYFLSLIFNVVLPFCILEMLLHFAAIITISELMFKFVF